jgi:hypothetical protein
MFGRGGVAWICLALLTVSPLPGARADAGGDCSAVSQSAFCASRDHARNRARQKTRAKQAKQREPAGTQDALLKSAVARLAPQRKGVTDLYTIAVAGWADQDVFVKELDGTLASLTKVLPVNGRVLRLVNGPDTAKGTPLATRESIAAAARAVADVMDKDEDIVILFMTSHGTRAGFGLQLPRRPLVEFAPRELATILDGAGIRNRVVIVSACYSGTFVPPLANDNTIVITAADARNPSFGCAPGREWTFFGDAFFNRSLRPGADLRSAFNGARLMISEWELAGALPPSNPQAHFGTTLVEKLAPLFAAKSSAAKSNAPR